VDPSIDAALSRGGVIDITTVGRRSGAPRRIEIVYHVIDGHVYISGMPGRPRDWLANMVADPHFTFHLKRGVRADLPAVAIPITDPDQRTAIFTEIVKVWTNQNVAGMVARSPLVEVVFPDLAA
jgi:deazaflavin-dependent oxidoreductase (nitroreductase family)